MIEGGDSRVDPRQFKLIYDAPNQILCSCGSALWPDCDVSAASVVETFEWHLRSVHGITREAIEEAIETWDEVQ